MKIHELDMEIVKREGKKKSLSIAQCKEVRRIIQDIVLIDTNMETFSNDDFYSVIFDRNSPLAALLRMKK